MLEAATAEQASSRLAGCPELRQRPELAQQLLDELAGQILLKRRWGKPLEPLPYLEGLIARARAGSFAVSAGLAVSQARERERQLQAAARHTARQALAELARAQRVSTPPRSAGQKPGSAPGRRWAAQLQGLRQALQCSAAGQPVSG